MLQSRADLGTHSSVRPSEYFKTAVKSQATEINQMVPILQAAIDALGLLPAPATKNSSARDWRRETFGNALIRLRQLAETDFGRADSLGLLAITRYVFELSVWLSLLKKDERYGLVYYRELIETQLKFYTDVAAHLRLQVDLLDRFETIEANELAAARDKLSQAKGKIAPAEAIQAAMKRTDDMAGRHFSLYLDQAKVNGYGYQAHRVRTDDIPRTEEAIAALKTELGEFDLNVPADVRALVKGRWQWRKMAEEVGLAHEHDYIYSYASKLLHATPASITTNEQQLELSERFLFLRYIRVKLVDAVDAANLVAVA